MGKTKNKARLHVKAAQCKSSNDQVIDMNIQDGIMANSSRFKAPSLGGGVFSNLDIDVNTLSCRIVNDEDDTRSMVTNKSLKALNLNKKERANLRNKVWLKKMETIQEAKRELEAKKKRQKTKVVGDMRSLLDNLPSMEELLKERNQEHQQTRCKMKPVKSEKNRMKDTKDGLLVFQQVLQDSRYKGNPMETIKEHLQNRMFLENRKLELKRN